MKVYSVRVGPILRGKKLSIRQVSKRIPAPGGGRGDMEEAYSGW